jgi:hypothetical protein
MSLVAIRMQKDIIKNKALMSSDHFLPMSLGSGANSREKIPPNGKSDPIHEICSGVGMKSNGDSERFSDIFAIDGLDQPIVVPQDTAIIFAIIDE